MNLRSMSQVLVNSNFFFILPFFPIYSSLQQNFELGTVHTDFSLFLFKLTSTFLVALFLLVSCLFMLCS